MQRRIHRAFTRARERTRVSYAKIAAMGGMCGVELIITKATSHDDFPLPEKYVHELLKIFAISPSTLPAFALAFARRFRRTQSWRVALKCLLLLHRLLRSLPDDGPFRAELLWARTNGVLSLYPCNFRDCTSSDSGDYTAFITAYARLLDESLDCVLIDEEDEDEEDRKSKDMGRAIGALPQLQSLIDRAIDCWPGGAASRSFLVQAAMKHVIRDSIWRYAAFRREIERVLESLISLPYRSCAAAFGVYRRSAAQAEELSRFHEWCKSMGYCGSYEYPLIDRIPEAQIRAVETFLQGMWQLTDPSSDSDEPSPLSSGDDRRLTETEAEVEPLIKWEDEEEEDGAGWEDLLEASIEKVASRNGWEMEVYNPNPNPYGFQTPNPFYQQQQQQQQQSRMDYGYGSCPNTPLQQPWIGFSRATCA